mgnify:FL=1
MLTNNLRLRTKILSALLLGSLCISGTGLAQNVVINTDADYTAATMNILTSYDGNIVPIEAVTRNTVTIGTVGNGDVPLIGTASTLKMVAGGVNVTGSNVENNTVTINSGKMKTVVGGVAMDLSPLGTSPGAVNNNSVNINGGTITADSANDFAVYGGAIQVATDAESVTGNKVTVNAGTITGWVVGGGSNGTGSVKGNSVTINGGTIVGSRVVGGSSAKGAEESNSVTVNGGNITADVIGARTGGGQTATKNKVILAGGTITGSVNGAEIIDTGTATANEVTIAHTTVNGRVNGGTAYDGSATNNIVTLNSGSVSGNVYGGSSNGAYDASNNTVNFNGGYVAGDIIGGYTASGGNPINNTINIKATLQGTDRLAGGYTTPQGYVTTGNTLNVYSLNNKVKQLGGFQNINFYLPAEAKDGSTALTITGSDVTDLTKTTVKAGVAGGSDLAIGDTVNLLVEPAGGSGTTINTTGMGTGTLTEGVSSSYDLAITTTPNSVLATITASPNGESRTLKAQAQSLTETRAAMAALVNRGADLAAGMGMTNAMHATEDNLEKSGIFAATNIYTLRSETGSYVDSKGVGLELGYAKRLDKGKTQVLVAPFLEYGYGKYDSYLDNDIHASGKSHFFGGGILARADQDSGIYYEGSLRYGRITSDYESSDLKNNLGLSTITYDTAAPYFAVHAGIGKINKLSRGNELDIYGKYFYSHTGSDTAKLNSGETYDFDAVNSNRIRLGARYNHPVSSGKVYVGLGVEHEFSGEARASYKNRETGAPTLRGTSGLMELGWKKTATKAQPMYADLTLTGWVGRQRGISFNAFLGWTF